MSPESVLFFCIWQLIFSFVCCVHVLKPNIVSTFDRFAFTLYKVMVDSHASFSGNNVYGVSASRFGEPDDCIYKNGDLKNAFCCSLTISCCAPKSINVINIPTPT